jgi:hypothetical protein
MVAVRAARRWERAARSTPQLLAQARVARDRKTTATPPIRGTAAASTIPHSLRAGTAGAAGAASLAPDLVLLPETPAGDEARERPRAEDLRSLADEFIVFEPHDFEEAFALCRELGARLVGAPRARAFEIALSREFARIAGAYFGRPRPRVAAPVGFAPLEFAGGHSFVTDLIEIAGGSCVTHGGAEPRIPMRTEQLTAFAPDLQLIVSPSELSESARRTIQQALPAAYPVEFLVFDAEQQWMHEAAEAAWRLRALIEPLSNELDRITRQPAAPAEGG